MFVLEDIAAVTGPTHFQVYKIAQPDLMRQLVRCAKSAGYRALVAPIDSGSRERDYRNGFTRNRRVNLKNAVQIAPRVIGKPKWLTGFVLDECRSPSRTPPRTHHSGSELDLPAITRVTAESLDLTWSDIEWMRDNWEGPLVVKGVLSPAEAARAREIGANAIVVANHRGRQLDGAPATHSALSGVVDALGSDFEALLDSGLRRGADVARTLALGARGVLVGRVSAWGLAVGGAAGARHSNLCTPNWSARCNSSAHDPWRTSRAARSV